MSALVKVLGGLAFVLGVEEALAAVFQLLAYVITNVFWSPGMAPSLTLETSAHSVSYFHLLPGYPILVCPFFLICGGLLGVLGQKLKDEEDKQRANELRSIEQARQKAEDERARRLSLAKRCDFLHQRNPNLVEASIDLHNSAEAALNLAANEFEGGYLDPFWDAVEDAATCLAKFHVNVHELAANLKELHAIDAGRGLFPALIQKVQSFDATSTAQRMKKLVREAQRSPSFSQIFHLRRTNKLLVDGFSTLGRAIDDMESYLSTSLNELSTLSEKESAARRDYEDQSLEMLDNIQRRRRPRE